MNQCFHKLKLNYIFQFLNNKLNKKAFIKIKIYKLILTCKEYQLFYPLFYFSFITNCEK